MGFLIVLFGILCGVWFHQATGLPGTVAIVVGIACAGIAWWVFVAIADFCADSADDWRDRRERYAEFTAAAEERRKKKRKPPPHIFNG